jgi:hypothetical protein
MIKSLGIKTAKWSAEVQAVLVECIRIAIECDSNIDPCIRLVATLDGSGAELKAIVKYLCTHAPVQVVNNALTFNKSFDGEFNAEYLNANPWNRRTAPAAKVLQELDVMEAFQAFITRMSKEVTLGQRNVVHAEALKELSALSGKLTLAYMTEEQKSAEKAELALVAKERAEQAATKEAQDQANIRKVLSVI